MRPTFFKLIWMWLSLFGATQGFAKSTPKFSGVLTDMQGNPIVSTEVKFCASIYSSLTNDPNESQCWSTKTNSKGAYQFPKLDLGGFFKFEKNLVSLRFPGLVEEGRRLSLETTTGYIFNINKKEIFNDFFSPKYLTFISYSFPLELRVPEKYKAEINLAHFNSDILEVRSGKQLIDYEHMFGAMTRYNEINGVLKFRKPYYNKYDYSVDKILEDWNGQVLNLKFKTRAGDSVFPIDGVFAPHVSIAIEINDLLNVDLEDFAEKVTNNDAIWVENSGSLSVDVKY